MKICYQIGLIIGLSAMLSACASVTTSEFSCKAPGAARCEPISQVNNQVDLINRAIEPPFDADNFWERP